MNQYLTGTVEGMDIDAGSYWVLVFNGDSDCYSVTFKNIETTSKPMCQPIYWNSEDLLFIFCNNRNDYNLKLYSMRGCGLKRTLDSDPSHLSRTYFFTAYGDGKIPSSAISLAI